MIESLREQLGKTEARLGSTMNLGGMSPLEFRGQCALVVAAAQRTLPAPELAAVQCRHAHGNAQIEGMKALAEYLQPAVDIDGMARLFIVGSIYIRGGQRDRRGQPARPSLRRISGETGVSMHRLSKQQALVRQRGEELEQLAEARLAGPYMRAGLTPQ